MNAARAIAIVVWLLSLVSTLLPAHRLHQPPGFDNLPRFVIALPVLFFGVGAFFAGYPFDSPWMRRWSDKRWGDGAYVRFIQDLKPILLCAAVPLAGGVVNVLRLHFAGVPVDVFYFGLSLSLASGFLLARVVLAWRGLPMESRSPGVWGGANRADGESASMLAAAIRRPRATKLTAALAGAALVAGPSAAVAIAELLFAPPPATVQRVGWVAMVLIFFSTMPTFVVGGQQDINSLPDARHAFKAMGRALVRGLCWMLGAAAAGTAALILAATVAFVRGLL
jgi:hypothetical protein